MSNHGGTLESYAERFVTERRKRGEITTDTARNQRCHLDGLARSFGCRPVEQLGQAAIERWQETIGHLSCASRRSQLSTVRVFCRWLVAGDPTRSDTWAPPGPTAPLRAPGPRLGRRRQTAANRRRPAGQAILWLMVGLGLRCCEVAHLQMCDYDPTGRTILVAGKGGHERVLPVPPEPAAVIDRYLSTVRVTAGPLIRSQRRPWCGLGADTLSKMVSAWMGDAGIKHRRRDGISAHALRHTAASDVLDACGDLRIVQQMLGHVHLATTSIYLRRADVARIREAMAGRDYGSAA